MGLKVVIDKSGYRMTELGLEPKRPLHFEEWEMLGQYLGDVHRGLQWALGDWLAYGENNQDWADKYQQAIEVTGLEYQTLANYRWVASRFELARRRTDLSWSHHAAVAGLEPARADAWLDQAVRNRWTVAELKAQVKEYERKAKRRVGTGGGNGLPGGVAEPRPERSLLERMKEDYITLERHEKESFVAWLQEYHGAADAEPVAAQAE